MPDGRPTSERSTKRRQLVKLVGVTTAGATLPFSQVANADDRTVERRPFSVSAPDGTELRGHVYLPTHEERPLAPVLSFGPYWNNNNVSASTGDLQPRATTGRVGSHASGIGTFPDEGFAFAAVNMRGTGISDGCFRFGDPIEIGDAYTVVEALADREWSTDTVGVWGGSYGQELA